MKGENVSLGNRRALSSSLLPIVAHWTPPLLYHTSIPTTRHPWSCARNCSADQTNMRPLPLVFACSHCIQQILEAVLHCHQMGVVHRDLKVSDECRLAVPWDCACLFVEGCLWVHFMCKSYMFIRNCFTVIFVDMFPLVKFQDFETSHLNGLNASDINMMLPCNAGQHRDWPHRERATQI